MQEELVASMVAVNLAGTQRFESDYGVRFNRDSSSASGSSQSISALRISRRGRRLVEGMKLVDCIILTVVDLQLLFKLHLLLYNGIADWDIYLSRLSRFWFRHRVICQFCNVSHASLGNIVVCPSVQ
ncbi:PREDICTED: uncharacterized protein LOC104613433 [Nelumbo nucifera]|uniref:Uncharacterized protein LOC104613433 n=1 Tax=Nelumbo nucifera TaxID=4432 RepID=A0A1U8BH62_NELNU|nr:PREDICTED: uncharacterized protein LOC104613433 [Nelumbo nucifera]